MLLIAAAGLALVVYAGIAFVLLTKYRQTRDLGFLILGCGLLGWPLASRILAAGMRTTVQAVANGEPITFFPFSLITTGQFTLGELFAFSTYANHVIHGSLILIGLLVIGRTIKTPRLLNSN